MASEAYRGIFYSTTGLTSPIPERGPGGLSDAVLKAYEGVEVARAALQAQTTQNGQSQEQSQGQ